MGKVHPLSGRKQSAEHIAKRNAARSATIKRNGGLLGAPGGRPANTPEILWSKVDKRGPDECWLWMGTVNKQGYGRTEINDKAYYAHRVIFALSNPGIIELEAPKDTKDQGWLRHTCDNPPCCNPRHLLVGTHQDNMNDKMERGRQVYFKSTKSPRAKLSEEEVLEIRRLKKQGATIKALALLYDVSLSCISHLLYGLSYQDI
jgi:hypothetical protein